MFAGVLPAKNRRVRAWAFLCAIFAALCCVAIFAAFRGTTKSSPSIGFGAKARMTVIAPMIKGQSWCGEAIGNPNVTSADQADALCNSLGKNGAQGIAKTLNALGPKRSPSGRFELGYTLILPLLRFYTPTAQGWRIDQHAIDVALSTVRDIDRPVVLHLSATHFNFEGQAFAAQLARDPRNLMWTKDGPLRLDKYFNTPIHAWTLVDDDAPVNRNRRKAFSAVLDSVCRLPDSVRQRIVAVTFLGETHQLFPDLQGKGASYLSDYVITDYSPAAKVGFRTWLRARFKTVQAMNRQIDGQFHNFQEIDPPSEDLIANATPNRLRHLDESAAGSIAIFGWAAGSSGPPPHISIYVDGNLEAVVLADLSRLDVLDARPEFGSRNVGFRYDLDYTKLSAGEHKIDLLARVGTSPPYFLGERKIDVLGDGNNTSASIRSGALPQARALDSEFSGYIDHPAPAIRVLYNPLAKLWNEYRYDQVTRFQELFSRIAARSCIPRDKLFSHQIVASLYPEYNEEKIGSAPSLKPNRYYDPGITMYGGSTYGDQFFDFKASIGWKSFGVGEFNPLVRLSPSEYSDMFNRLNAAGAVYISPYHLSAFNDYAVDEKLISPYNMQRGEPEFYRAISDLMHND